MITLGSMSFLALIGLVFAIGKTAFKVEGQQVKTPMMLSATDFYRDYRKNEFLANEKYVDNLVKLIGVVKSVLQKDNGKIVLTLNTTPASRTNIKCTVHHRYSNRITLPAPGDRVVLDGNCIGMLNDILMENCEIISIDK